MYSRVHVRSRTDALSNVRSVRKLIEVVELRYSYVSITLLLIHTIMEAVAIGLYVWTEERTKPMSMHTFWWSPGVLIVEAVLNILFLLEWLVVLTAETDKKRYLISWLTIVTAFTSVPTIIIGIGTLADDRWRGGWVPMYLRVWWLNDCLTVLLDYPQIAKQMSDTTRGVARFLIQLFSILVTCVGINQMVESCCGKYMDIYDSLYVMVVAFATIGYGDLTPKTTPARLFMIIFMVIGVCYFIPLFQTFARLARERVYYCYHNSWKGRYPHIIIVGDCGPLETELILKNLYAGWRKYIDLTTVLLVPQEPPPQTLLLLNSSWYKDRVKLLVGDPAKDEDLRRCDAKYADAIFLYSSALATTKFNDYLVIKQSLRIHQFDPNLPQHIIFQREQHTRLVTSYAASVVESERLMHNLLGLGAVVPGMIPLVINLLRTYEPMPFDVTTSENWTEQYEVSLRNDFFFVVIPNELQGKSFLDVALLYYEHTVTLMGVITPKGRVIFNPTGKIHNAAKFILIAKSKQYAVAATTAAVSTSSTLFSASSPDYGSARGVNKEDDATMTGTEGTYDRATMGKAHSSRFFDIARKPFETLFRHSKGHGRKEASHDAAPMESMEPFHPQAPVPSNSLTRNALIAHDADRVPVNSSDQTDENGNAIENNNNNNAADGSGSKSSSSSSSTNSDDDDDNVDEVDTNLSTSNRMTSYSAGREATSWMGGSYDDMRLAHDSPTSRRDVPFGHGSNEQVHIPGTGFSEHTHFSPVTTTASPSMYGFGSVESRVTIAQKGAGRKSIFVTIPDAFEEENHFVIIDLSAVQPVPYVTNEALEEVLTSKAMDLFNVIRPIYQSYPMNTIVLLTKDLSYVNYFHRLWHGVKSVYPIHVVNGCGLSEFDLRRCNLKNSCGIVVFTAGGLSEREVSAMSLLVNLSITRILGPIKSTPLVNEVTDLNYLALNPPQLHDKHLRDKGAIDFAFQPAFIAGHVLSRTMLLLMLERTYFAREFVDVVDVLVCGVSLRKPSVARYELYACPTELKTYKDVVDYCLSVGYLPIALHRRIIDSVNPLINGQRFVFTNPPLTLEVVQNTDIVYYLIPS